jgi:asparagine synthase (glutamine-hydrolysing)
VLHRRTKAYFNGVVVGASSRAFIERWSGGGVDPDLVDPDLLREEWQRPLVHAGTNCLLQAAWLAEEGSPRPVGEMADPAPL